MMKLLFTILISSFIIAAHGQQLNLMSPIPNDSTVRVGTMANGIKYYIKKNTKNANQADFHIIYNVGSIQEEDNQNGLAHFLEHMAFNGSKHFPKTQMIDYLQSIGVKFGKNLNAQTGQEVTTYMITNVPLLRESIIDSTLLILHDWAGYISLDSKDIDKERGVIIEEWRQGNNASRRIREKQMPVIFNNSIYAKRNVIGSEQILKSFTHDDLRSFYKKWYRPDMLALVIVGDVDIDQVEAKLKATMSHISYASEKSQKQEIIIEQNAEPTISICSDPELQATQVQLLFRHKPINAKYRNMFISYKHDILNKLIFIMLNERLSDIANSENAPFLFAQSGYNEFVKPFNLFSIVSACKNDEALKAFDALYLELVKMQKGGFTTSEFERAKSILTAAADQSYNNRNDRKNSEYVKLLIDNFIKNSAYPAAEDQYKLVQELCKSTSLDEVNAAAASLVKDENSSILISAPASTALPSELDLRSKIKQVKEAEIAIKKDYDVVAQLLNTEQIKAGKTTKQKNGKFGSTVYLLSNGAKVILKKSDFKADEIILSGVQKGGTATIENIDDLTSLQFYPYFFQNAGLGQFSQNDLNKILSGKTASAAVSFNEFETVVTANCVPKDIETMFQLIYLRLVNPRFEQTDLNVVLNQWKALLPNFEQNPDFIYSIETLKTITNSNPRALAQVPQLKTLDVINIDRLKKGYEQLTNNVNGMTYVIIGNFDETTIRSYIEKYIASLPSSQHKSAFGQSEILNATGEIENIFKTPMKTPKVTASVVYSGNIDWNLMERLNLNAIRHILDLRYTKSIREDAGGTYGVRVKMQPEQYLKPEFGLSITFNTDSTRIEQLLPLIYKEVENLVLSNISDEDIIAFKEFSVKEFNDNLKSNRTWKNYLEDWYVRDNDNYTDYARSLDLINKASLQKTAEKIFEQKNRITIIQKP